MEDSEIIDWKKNVVDLMILDLLRLKGFSKVDEISVRLLRELFIGNLFKIMLKVKKISENNRRNESNIFDLLKVIESNGFSIQELSKYLSKNKDKFKNSKEISDSNPHIL